MTARPSKSRGRASAALVAVTAVLLVATALTGYVRSELVDERAFAGRTASALDDPEVRRLLATRMVNGLARSTSSDLLAVRPLLVSAVTALVDTPPFRRLFIRAIERRHRGLVAGEADFVLTLPAEAPAVVDSLRSVSPALARAVPRDLELRVAALDRRDSELRGARLLRDVAGWWWPLLVATLLSAAACAALAGGLRRALRNVGAAVAVGGVAVALVVAGLERFVTSHAAAAADLDDEGEREAIGAIWTALFGDLGSAALTAALGGVALVALGWAARGRPATGRDRLRRATESGGVASRRLLAGAVAAVLAVTVTALVLILPGPSDEPAGGAASSGECNGSRVLCDRRLNEAVFPATHNSYAAANRPGWLFAHHRLPIDRQLEDGIRAFLIDIHWGVRDPRRRLVRTALREEGSDRNKVLRELGPTAVATAERLVGRIGAEPPGGDPRLYLCHTLCELGSEPLGEQLDVFAAFLEANPEEVVILFVEPYVPVVEIERAMRAAGLLEQAARLERDEPLPTLGDLVRDDTRLIVLAEEDGGARDWYLPGFSFVQDTELGVTSPSESCRRVRGTPDSPLFLVNHWDTRFPPSKSRNQAVGGDVLRDRVASCRRGRGLVPNLVAVDFHELTGVVELARRLNAERR